MIVEPSESTTTISRGASDAPRESVIGRLSGDGDRNALNFSIDHGRCFVVVSSPQQLTVRRNALTPTKTIAMNVSDVPSQPARFTFDSRTKHFTANVDFGAGDTASLVHKPYLSQSFLADP